MSARDQYAYLRPQPQVWFAIIGSALVHAGLIVMLIIGGLVRTSSAGPDKVRITALLRKGKPRPKDWLPRKLPAPAPALPREVRPDPKADPAKAQPAPKSSAGTDYSKAMNQALKSLQTQPEGGKSDEEPEGSPDGVEGGDSLVAQAGNEYATKIYKAVAAQYALPEIISPRERMFLRAKVKITLDASGRIRDLVLVEPSENSVFNSAIEGAVRRAGPFPPPPEEIAAKVASEGVFLNFYARNM